MLRWCNLNVRKTKKNYILAVCSNGITDLDLSDMRKYSDFLDQVDVYQKPHPDMFDFILKKANILTIEMLHVGDDWKNDVRGNKCWVFFIVDFDKKIT